MESSNNLFKTGSISDSVIMRKKIEGWELTPHLETDKYYTFQQMNTRGKLKFWRVCNLWKISGVPCLLEHKDKRRLETHCQTKHQLITIKKETEIAHKVRIKTKKKGEKRAPLNVEPSNDKSENIAVPCNDNAADEDTSNSDDENILSEDETELSDMFHHLDMISKHSKEANPRKYFLLKLISF